MCASILLISCSSGVDMQQDRSTGWRLGTNRTNQFRYQVIGILMGAILSVALAKIFMASNPVLRLILLTIPTSPGAAKSAIGHDVQIRGRAPEPDPSQLGFRQLALEIGIAGGFVIESLRKLIKRNAAYQRFVRSGPKGRAADFVLDAFILSSPYASSFGGFVIFTSVAWFTIGGLFGSLWTCARSGAEPCANCPSDGAGLPDDMSDPSLIGGGLIAGDSLAALGLGLWGLLGALFGK